MKYEGQRPSGKDKDILLYNFVFGQEELRALHQSLVFFQEHCPKIVETHIIRTRIATMIKSLRKFSVEYSVRIGNKSLN